jgi:hypothetical protein
MGLPSLPPMAGGQKPPRAATHSLQLDLTGMPVDELLELRAQIEQRLPVKQLKDLNLEQELVLQLLTSQQLQRDVLQDDEIPANQRAQCLNAVAAIIAQLVKLQTEVYTSERLKRIEGYLIESLRQLPLQGQAKFLELYEAGEGKALQ